MRIVRVQSSSGLPLLHGSFESIFGFGKVDDVPDRIEILRGLSTTATAHFSVSRGQLTSGLTFLY